MGAHRTVVKHSYLTGDNQGMGRAQAHVRYIQFRGGKDKDEEQRSFFNGTRDEIIGKEVRDAVACQNVRATVMHKLILSPGVQGADVKEYCREVMADLSSRKGLDLDWYGVQHDNTDNPHVHIVVMGKDENGRRVKLTKADYTKIKEAGDRYLERNRLLDREEKDKEREPSKEHKGPARIFEAIKAAAREFSRVIDRDEKDDKKPESKFEQRKREKEQERNQEVSALGDSVDLDEVLLKQAEKEERDKTREEAQKEKAWKEYCQPIKIDRGGHEPLEYDRASSMQSLRDLEKDYKNEDAQVRASMTEADYKRLNDWTKEKYREDKKLENKAEKLENIDVELDKDSKFKWDKESSLVDLRALEKMNIRAEVYLDPVEQKALQIWIKDQERKEPIRIELEPGSEPMVYDKDDSKESMQFILREYEKGETWATESLSKDDYKKIRSWIYDKNKAKEADTKEKTEPEKDPEHLLRIGKTEDGKDKFVSKLMDADTLKVVREELKKEPEKNKEVLGRLDNWIEKREREERKDPNRRPRRKQSAREKLLDRAVQQNRSKDWDNYYKEKFDQRERLQEERANLQAQKRALNKFEKERETVDGQYSEIWGADKSAIAAGPRGAASGGLRPLGANQIVKLLTQAKDNWEQKQKVERGEAAKDQKVLEARLSEGKKIEKPAEKVVKEESNPLDKPKDAKKAEKSVEKEETKEEKTPVLDNSNLETDTKNLGKEVENKKKKEEDRDPHKSIEDRDQKDKWDPNKHDPWGRW